MRKFFFLSFVLVCAASAFGQNANSDESSDNSKKAVRTDTLAVQADVKDHISHEAIKNLRAELLFAADSSRADTASAFYFEDSTWNYKQSGIGARITMPGRYLFKVEHDDYVTKYVPFEVKKIYKRERSRELPTVYMRTKPKRNEYDLGDVVIKATKLKFYMDGDTLVYDADAFNLAEGSMLDGLLKKLPGVELEQGGVIKVNGRQIDALLLNGKDFFNEDRELLLENMPAYMVKNIQSYERVPENVRGTNKEGTTRKELVMNVKLKKEYNRGWIANAEGGGGATFFRNRDGNLEGKHLARLFGLRFDDRSRLSLFFNANNLNDYRVPGEKGEWSPLTQSQGLAARYKLGGNYRVQKDDHYRYEGSVTGTYSDLTDENQASRATFLEGGDTYGKSFSGKRSYDWDVETRHRLTLERHTSTGDNLFKYIYANFSPYFKYMHWNNRSNSANVTLSEDVEEQLGKAWLDSIQAPNAGELLRRYAVNRTLSRAKANGHWLESRNNGYLVFGPAHNDYVNFDLNYAFDFTNRSEDNFEHYRLDYPNSTDKETDQRNRYNPTRQKQRSFNVEPEVSFNLDKEYHHTLYLRYEFNYRHDDNQNPLYLLNKLEEWRDLETHPLGTLPSMDEMLSTIDKDNSSYTKKDDVTHSPRVTYRWQNYKDNVVNHVSISMHMPVNHEKLDYRQGTQVDTLMRRTTTFLQPQLSFWHENFKRGQSIMISYNLSSSAPTMTSLLNIRNDNNPLYVTLGNPNLKNSRNHNLYTQYRDKFGKTMVNVSANGFMTENAVASGFIYDRETGVRTVRPENVNGNWTLNLSSGVDFPFDKDDKWRMKENLSFNVNHSVDLNGTNETMVATKSVVRSRYLIEELDLAWKPTSKMEYGLNGKLNYQRSTSNRASFTNLNVFTYQYGARCQMELPWDIQLSTDLTMYSRRGYSESSMNTDELVWNARVAKRLMHGNLILMFDGFDLLGNLSNVRRYINAQGRSETFYNVIPSYGLFHVVWRLNKQPKNKQSED